MRLLVGLGNPGAEYESTRHNAGFWLMDRIASTQRASFRSESRFHGEVTRITLSDGTECWLLKPMTYMNESGRAVAALARFYRIPAEEILVAHDELDLPPGSLKLKHGGGAAGHNGIKDSIAALGSNNFWRLRIGIGHPGERNQVVDYVLHRPSRSEHEAIEQALDRVEAVMPMILRNEMALATQKLHVRPKAHAS